jgi:large subunit ribosomal protein L24e
MVDKRSCSFCGNDIEPGTGKMYIKKDGTKYHFCSHKCQMNLVKLKRVNRNVRWTTHFEKHPGPTPPKEGKKKSTKAAAPQAEAAEGEAPAKKAPSKKTAKKAAAPKAE